MTIAIGTALPETTLFEMTDAGPAKVPSTEVFAGRTVALFGVPGAFTPTCHVKHVPSFIENAEALAAKGVDAIVCVAVNDPFVLRAWGKETGATAAGIRMLGDPAGELARAMGLDFDASAAGLGVRCKRFSALVRDGVVAVLNVEDVPSKAEATTGGVLLGQI